MYDLVQLPTYHPFPVKETGKNRTISDTFCVYIVVENGLSIWTQVTYTYETSPAPQLEIHICVEGFSNCLHNY